MVTIIILSVLLAASLSANFVLSIVIHRMMREIRTRMISLNDRTSSINALQHNIFKIIARDEILEKLNFKSKKEE